MRPLTPRTPHLLSSIVLVVLRCVAAASGSAALQKVNGIMKKEDYLQILQENLKSSAEDWILGAAGCSHHVDCTEEASPCQEA